LVVKKTWVVWICLFDYEKNKKTDMVGIILIVVAVIVVIIAKITQFNIVRN